jgi:uncharacterized protein (UPF0297 family)
VTEKELKIIFDEVVFELTEKGYSPYDHIMGYLEMGSDCYITRHGNAREKIKLLDKERLKHQVKELK